jgi:hemolysin activation/secretion protein
VKSKALRDSSIPGAGKLWIAVHPTQDSNRFLTHVIYMLCSLAMATSPSWTFSQTLTQLPQVPPQVPQGPLPPRPPQLPEKPPPTEPPPLEAPAPQPPQQREEITGPSVVLREIRVTGNTAVADQELAEITQPYLNRQLTTEDIEALRLALTFYYVNRGYVTSGAIIPDQVVTDGVLTIQIIEGKLAAVNVEGNKWFRSSYFEKRLQLVGGPPLNVNLLQERLQLLQTDPRVERLNADLRPGPVRGESELDLRVKEANPFKAWLEFNNYLSPAVGAESGYVTLAHQNVLGFGDTLSLQYGRSAGVHPILNFLYSIPVTSRDTTVSIQYRRFEYKVTEDPFDVLDLRNKSQIIGVSVRHPFYRTLQEEFALSLALDYEENKSFLLGMPAELVPGASNGVFRIAALRFMQDWVRRDEHQVFSAVSRLSLGIGALGATANGNPEVGDGRFFSWLGQAQWLRQFETLRAQLLGRATLQLSNDHLFPLEQTPVGGRYSVRGYREFTLIRDNAFIVSLEPRIPVYTSTSGTTAIFFAPFVDVGHGWQTTVSTPTDLPQTLASVGAGVIANFWKGSHFELYWGQQLNHFSTGRGNLQDHGIHLQLIVQAL